MFFTPGTHAGKSAEMLSAMTAYSWSAVSLKFKMAAECKGACFNTEQVVELIFLDDTDLERTQSNESDSEVEEVNLSDNFIQTERHKKLLSSWLDKLTFENENINKTFFKQTALEQLLPLIDRATNNTNGNESEAAYLLRSSSICSLTVLSRESKHWLGMIHRRLAGRKRIKKPYFAEMHRNVPYEIFGVIKRMIVSQAKDFQRPECYVESNSKGEVVSFTSKKPLVFLFSLLSGMSTRKVKHFLQRALTGKRHGFTTKVLISNIKDFAFVYIFKTSELIIQYHYGEWNSHGFPLHV